MNAQGTTKKGAAYSHPPKFDNVIFCRLLKSLYLCIAFEKKHQALSRGVMVTHLILVQTFKVRVLTGQLTQAAILYFLRGCGFWSLHL